MTVTFWQLLTYAGAMLGLWLVPGPVWVALLARALSGGFRAAWPLAAILGLSWIVTQYGEVLSLLRWVAAVVFLVMGVMLMRAPAKAPGSDSRLTRPGVMAGFTVGLAAVIGNPKAILFYMGALPGFFDLSRLTWPDILAIICISGFLPMGCNLLLSKFLDRARDLLSSPENLRRLNLTAGGLLIAVACVIPFL